MFVMGGGVGVNLLTFNLITRMRQEVQFKKPNLSFRARSFFPRPIPFKRTKNTSEILKSTIYFGDRMHHLFCAEGQLVQYQLCRDLLFFLPALNFDGQLR